MKYLFLLSLCLSTLILKAQDTQQLKKLVVADIETRVPMRGVIVSTQSGYRDTTNWRGICYVPQNFDTLTVYKSNYIPERLVPKELKDSTYLIPAGSAISEVTVWGKNNIQDNIKSGMNGYTPLPSPGAGIVASFDLAKILDRRGRRDQKHLRKVRQKFSEMDASEDPIEHAYQQALDEEAAKKEREEKAAQKAE